MIAQSDPAVQSYLAFLTRAKKSPTNTVDAYGNDLDQLTVFLTRTQSAGSLDWSTVTETNLIAFITHLKDKGYKTNTLARKTAAIKSFFDYLWGEGIIRANPAEDLESPKRPTINPVFVMTPEEMETLLQQPANKQNVHANRDAAMLRLLRATGMRVSEFLDLNIDDIDLASGTVRCRGKGTHERQIPIDRKTAALVAEYISSARRTLMHNTQRHDALFVNHRGERITRQGVHLIIKAYARMAKLPRAITTHTLRQSFAVHLLQRNTRLRDVQTVMGHANIATTSVYAQEVAAMAAAR